MSWAYQKATPVDADSEESSRYHSMYSQNYLLNKLIFSLYITKGSDNTVQ